MQKYFFLAFFISLATTPLFRLIAVKVGLVATPRSDRWHKKSTALLGGAAIYLGSLVPFLILRNVDSRSIGLLCGATFLFFFGLADDRFGFAPYVKLFAQIIAGGIAVMSGITIGLPLDGALNIPLTLLWIIVITNSFNLLDNIDGLAAGIAVISCLTLYFSAWIYSNNTLAVYALILAAAAAGFLPYNFNPAKIFMGDSGSMFLGYSIGVISISGTPRHVSNLLITMFVPVLILSVPIFDTIFVMFIRQLQGRKIFEGGRDHTSHRLVALGLSQKKTVLVLYSISIVFSLIAISYSRLNMLIVSIVAFLGMVILMFFGLFLFEGSSSGSKLGLYRKNAGGRSNRVFVNAVFLHKRRIAEVLLDCMFICIAYYCAYFLRFEGSILASNMFLLTESLVWIIIIKMSIFFVFGLYRGVWRYIGISDFFTIFKVTSLSTAASVLFLTFKFRFKDYSRTLFFIDWLLLLFLILGSRFMFRIIGEFFARLQKTGKKVLIFGAGDMGEMVVREIKRNKLLNYIAVGFVDDNARKVGSKINGVLVMGTREKIPELIAENGIGEVIIAISGMSKKEFLDVAQVCKECGVAVRKAKGILDDDDAFQG